MQMCIYLITYYAIEKCPLFMPLILKLPCMYTVHLNFFIGLIEPAELIFDNNSGTDKWLFLKE